MTGLQLCVFGISIIPEADWKTYALLKFTIAKLDRKISGTVVFDNEWKCFSEYNR